MFIFVQLGHPYFFTRQKNSIIRLINNSKNRGYGRALIEGFQAARGEYVFFSDGDNQFNLKEISLLMSLIKDCDAVVGYRKKRKDTIFRIFFAKCWNVLVKALFNIQLKDINCAFKLFKRDILDKIDVDGLQSNGAVISTEIIAKIMAQGGVVVQCPVTHYPRSGGKASGANPQVILKAFYELVVLRKKLISG